ncbi:Amidase signature domain [Trinorchestia longiramus]|nr:Amidase signature domain [Trinorchestia longiramus]
MGAVMHTTLTLLLTVSWPLLRVLRRVYDRVVHAAFALFFSFKKKTPLPPVFNPNLLLSATQIAKAIREQKRTSVSVVRAYISRISDVNPLLNALAQEAFQDALQEARRVDDRITQVCAAGSACCCVRVAVCVLPCACCCVRVAVCVLPCACILEN